MDKRLEVHPLSIDPRLPRLAALGVALLFTGCPAPGPDGFGVDSSTPEPRDETSECSPSLTVSGVASGTSDTLGTYARFSFTWVNGECGGLVSSGSVQAHSLNLDAEDPTSVEANVYYEIPLATQGTEGARVTLDDTNLTASIDLPLTEEADEYEVTVLVVDSLGYTSNILTWNVIYEEITDSVE